MPAANPLRFSPPFEGLPPPLASSYTICMIQQPKQNLTFHLTFLALSTTCLALFFIIIMLRSRWSVASFSAFTSFFMVLTATLQVLTSFNEVWHRYYAPGEAPANTLLTNATSSPVIPIPDEYDDTLDLLYVTGVASLSLMGAGIYPAWSRLAWTPYVVPLVYLVVSGAWPQPLERFLQVSLLHVLMLLQVRAGEDPAHLAPPLYGSESRKISFKLTIHRALPLGGGGVLFLDKLVG